MTNSSATVCRSRRTLVLAGFLAIAAYVLAPGPAVAQVVMNPVVVSGAAAPAGGNYSNLNFYPPVLNASGQVAYYAKLAAGSSTEGIFAGSPGSLKAVALQGNAAPAGGNYGSFAGPINPPLALNASGQVAFFANLTGGSSTQGLFVGAPGSVQAAALQGNVAPNSGGNTYSTFSSLALNDAGQVAFRADLIGDFVGAPGSVQPAALLNTPAPSGGNYLEISPPVLNAAGQVAVRSHNDAANSAIYVGTPGAMQTGAVAALPQNGTIVIPGFNSSGQLAFLLDPFAIYMGPSGSTQAVVTQGSTSPAGGNYNQLYSPSLNSSGQIAFRASLTGGSSTEGIFVGSPAALKAAALQGLLAPNGNGATYSTFDGVDAFNGAGQVAFEAGLTGTGVTSANNLGLYAGSPGGMVEVVRTGDMIDEGNGTGLHTVSSIGFTSSGLALNDSGMLAYSLSFTDGTSGVFTSTIPVPEPSSGLLVLAGLLAAVRFRKRLSK